MREDGRGEVRSGLAWLAGAASRSALRRGLVQSGLAREVREAGVVGALGSTRRILARQAWRRETGRHEVRCAWSGGAGHWQARCDKLRWGLEWLGQDRSGLAGVVG